MRTLLLISLATALALPTTAQAVGWREITLPDGPGTDVPKLLDVAMDGGVVWFSTELDGIMGYDGAEWVLHTQADGGLRHDKYRFVMFVDSAGDHSDADALCPCRVEVPRRHLQGAQPANRLEHSCGAQGAGL